MNDIEPQENSKRPPNMIALYMEAIDGNSNDPFLDQINMGVGKYNDAEYWQQVGAFRKGMYGEAAMGRKVMERAKREAKEALVDAIYDNDEASLLSGVTYPAPGDQDRDEYLAEHGDMIWDGLGTAEISPSEHKAIIIREATGLPDNWVPPHMRMIKFRHKASQSKGAQLIDNLFERVQEYMGGPAQEFEK